jgi:hypothetical protein
MLFFTVGSTVTDTCKRAVEHVLSTPVLGFVPVELKSELGNKTHLFQCLLFFVLQHSLLLDKFIPLMNIVFSVHCQEAE